MFTSISRLFIASLTIGFLVIETACAEKSQSDQMAAAGEPDQTAASQPSNTTGKAAGVQWNIPGRWTSQAERPMRVATCWLGLYWASRKSLKYQVSSPSSATHIPTIMTLPSGLAVDFGAFAISI